MNRSIESILASNSIRTDVKNEKEPKSPYRDKAFSSVLQSGCLKISHDRVYLNPKGLMIIEIYKSNEFYGYLCKDDESRKRIEICHQVRFAMVFTGEDKAIEKIDEIMQYPMSSNLLFYYNLRR